MTAGSQAKKMTRKRRSKKQARIETHEVKQLLRSALRAKQKEASPIASKFKVGASGLWKDGASTTGWNIEYGGVGYLGAGMQSVHAEQMMVAGASRNSRIATLSYFVVIGGQSDDPQAPCGDCREAIKVASDDDTRIVIRKYGDQETLDDPSLIVIKDGGEVKAYSLHSIEDLLPTKFKKVNVSSLPGVEQQLIDRFYPKSGVRGFNGLSELFSKDLNEDMNIAYAVARFADGDEEGFQMDTPEFHQVSAVASVLSRAWAREKPMLSLHVFSNLRHLCGRDRQFIYTYASRHRVQDDHGMQDDFPVFITKIGSRQPKSVMQTTPSELLPFGFSESYIERGDEDYQRPR